MSSGLRVVEEVVLGALEVVLHRELDVDDVLVVGQHQRFLVDLVLRRVAVADLDGPHLREVDELDRLDRERQVPARARLRGLGVLAEARDDAAAAFVDDVEAAREPDDERRARRACRRRRSARPAPAAAPPSPPSRLALAAEELVHPAIDVAPDLVEIGRAAAAALAPLRIVQRHDGGVWNGCRDSVSVGASRVRRRDARPAVARPVRGVGGNRSASAARNSAHAGAGQARSDERREFYQTRRARRPAARPAASHLVAAPGSAARRSAPISASTRVDRRDLLVAVRRARASTTCSSRSASAASSSVARNAATRSCGRSRMKPTVSDSTIGSRAGHVARGASSCRASRTAGRRRSASAPVRRLKSVDLPALV